MQDKMLFIWLLLLIIFIIVELATMGLTTIWFAAGALVAALAAVVNAPLVVQVGLFLVISIVLMLFTRPLAVRYFNKERIKTNVESMVGRQAIVISEIDNLEGIGQVTVSGQEWAARSLDENLKIPVGTVVFVRAISGVKLLVEPKAENI
ncbi:MAG: NfeD family protein [Lachnospiraceae bacterium]|nr:NfeD family protein [Lachnospiraceae bacterium]